MYAGGPRDRTELPIDGGHHLLFVLGSELGSGDPCSVPHHGERQRHLALQLIADTDDGDLRNVGVSLHRLFDLSGTQPVTGDKCNNVKGRAALISCLQPDRGVEVEVIGSK